MKENKTYEKPDAHWSYVFYPTWVESDDWYHCTLTYLGRPKTHNERRSVGNATEQGVRVRAKRNAHHLASDWDDKWVPSTKSWKKSHRCKKQYLKNI